MFELTKQILLSARSIYPKLLKLSLALDKVFFSLYFPLPFQNQGKTAWIKFYKLYLERRVLCCSSCFAVVQFNFMHSYALYKLEKSFCIFIPVICYYSFLAFGLLVWPENLEFNVFGDDYFALFDFFSIHHFLLHCWVWFLLFRFSSADLSIIYPAAWKLIWLPFYLLRSIW